MTPIAPFVRTALLAGFVAACGSAAADPIFLAPAVNLTPGGVVSGDPLIRRNEFESLLVTGQVRTDGFSGYPTTPVAAPIKSLDLGSTIGASLSMDVGAGRVATAETDVPANGRFDTTGGGDITERKWWLTAYSFTLTFDQGISALGFYGTDLGDFDGGFEIELLRANQAAGDGEVKTLKSTMSTNADAVNGTLQFFGFYDPDPQNAYTQVIFRINQTATDVEDFDFLGFDDIVVGPLAPGGGTVPEPGSLALVGAALLGVAAARRRRQA